MQERIHELETRYKYFLLKKYLKYLFFIILIAIMVIFFIIMMQVYNQQKSMNLKTLEYKRNLEQKIIQAQILQEKNKIAKEKLHKELKALQENNNKIKIDSQALNILHLRKSFYQNPSYEKALNLANKYFEIQAYNKSVFWALKANELDRQKQDSWLVFARAKKALGQEKEAKRALDAYINYYGFIELDGK